ncbi:MAG: TonB-dependent receptor [Flavobacteriales bacterium]|nr:TonB-dependent receptor [Flavobacteriales bacterium]
MFYRIKTLIIIMSIPMIALSQQDSVIIKKELEEVNVNALRANKETPVAYTNINKLEIEENNLGQDLPYIISLTPSLVTTSDAGAGIGYTSFRIRGSDPTRINVTINGIPLNDSESQGVWWVNMPDFSSSIENIQIQRGVGTSTNGSSAFGASINLKTDKFKVKPYVLTNNTAGSFSTMKNNIEFGSGLINNKFAFDARLSKIKSDGYIDRATSDLQSLYLQAGYFSNNSVLKGIIFTGKERTYQAWNGVPLNYLDTNRTYNIYTYENEVDNYQQTHYQLHYNKQISDKTTVNLSTHYTHGEGYYEQEKMDEQFLDYGLNNLIIGQDTITTTDLIRRKWLNNDFGGVVFSIHQKLNNLNLILGGGMNKYSGQHYGNIIWSKYASNGIYDYQYYWNKGEKYDRNLYAKGDYRLNSKTNIMIDLQQRRIMYLFEGYDEEGITTEQEVTLDFFNPKFGIFHNLNSTQAIYASFAVGNKEPNRNDYVESTPTSRPIHETLYDTEIGYKHSGEKIYLGFNLYHMNYKNQLVLTGQINDVGAYTRKNIDESFRQGLEMETSYKFNDKITFNGNITLSENKIEQFTEYIDNWDTWGQETIIHENTDLAFSPKIIWASKLDYQLNKSTTINFISKYVGEQFIDNTSSEDRKLNDYLVNHFQITYLWKNKIFRTSKIKFRINNILNNEYVSNAWVYRFISDQWDPRDSDPYVNKDSERGYNMAGYFPEATRNYLISLTLGF